MLNIFTLTITQLINMFFFMVVGYVMRKRKIGGEGVGTVLSSLLVNLFCPAITFSSMSEWFHLSELAENITFVWAACVTLLLTFPVANVLGRWFGKTGMEKDIYTYGFLFSNTGYIGTPLVEAVFGSQVLFYYMLFLIPYTIVTYTYGLYILNPKRELSWKRILNPNMIAMILGILVGMTEVKLPAVITSIVYSAKGCMSVSAMILTGFVLGVMPIRSILKEGKLYLTALVRCVFIPVAGLLICYWLKVDAKIMTIICTALAMPMGLNSVVFAESFGGDSKLGAKTSFMTNLLCIITIPIVFALLEFLT